MGPLDWRQRHEAFRGASVVVVPSRYEPFGMGILEAMLYRVPLVYPQNDGAAEIIGAGIAVDPEDIQLMSEKVRERLLDWRLWKKVVDEQTSALDEYMKTAPESALREE